MTDLDNVKAKVESYRANGFDSTLTGMQSLIGATVLRDAHTYLDKQYPECSDWRYSEAWAYSPIREAVRILGLLESQLRSAVEFKLNGGER